MPVHPLVPRFLEKVWGSSTLFPWFPDSSLRIGEVWLEHPSGTPLPLLIKFLFTTERLSVQVHPGDSYAQEHHQSNGKTEMWHILRAGPAAQIALGLNQPLTAAELHADSRSGAIEQKLNWIDVHPGETFFVPAGTIHAIGGGLAVCEIQQQSDVTYRLYDYGRPRELHLDRGVEVSDLRKYEQPPEFTGCLAESAYFRTERLKVDAGSSIPADPARTFWLICIEGPSAGQAWQVDSGTNPIEIPVTGNSVLIKTFVPQIPLVGCKAAKRFADLTSTHPHRPVVGNL